MALLSGRAAAVLVLVSGLLLQPAAARAQEGAERPEYAVKSAYLVNFLTYTTWPDSVLGPGDPLRLCIMGTDPFGDFLGEVSEGRSIHGHPLRVVQVDRVVEADRCHAGFIAERNRIAARVWLDRLAARPVLTIGEGGEFLGAGGMIALVLEARTVRFDVNAPAMNAAGLSLSSRVLRLARNAPGD
ncbi:MAG TPA: YfiR family protein [Gemmatimonadales bacterium]|nr:YfiR family protein [Gemmatimonadales bacterium]